MGKLSSGAGCQRQAKKFTPGNGGKLLKNGCKGEVPGRIHPVVNRNAQIQPRRNPKEGGSAKLMPSREAGLWKRNRGNRHPASGIHLRSSSYGGKVRHLSLVICHLSFVTGTGYFNGLRNLYSANPSFKVDP